MHLSKPKANTEHLFCNCQLVATFKAYITVVMNKFIYAAFQKVGCKHPAGEVANPAAVLSQIYQGICLPKIIKIKLVLKKLLQK